MKRIAGEMNMAEAPKVTRKKRLDAIHAKRSANGGFIAEHRFDNSGPGFGYHDPEEHTFGQGEGKKFLSHIAEHLGVKMEPDADDKKG